MFDELKRQARVDWAKWARTVAAGGQPPAPVQLLKAGGMLGITHPGDALERDAAAICEVRQLEQQADQIRQKFHRAFLPVDATTTNATKNRNEVAA